MEFLPIKINGEKVYAGFWRRFGAAIIDMLVFIPVIVISQFLEGLSIAIAMLSVIVSGALFAVYTAYFHYKFGATLGKMAIGIKVVLPDGQKIGLKQALLRSVVDFGFAFFAVIAHVIAISNVDPAQYLYASFVERAEYILPLFPAWYGLINLLRQLWYWSEFIVLLFNKRKRAIHDFIAGTVVIREEYAAQNVQQNATEAVSDG